MAAKAAGIKVLQQSSGYWTIEVHERGLKSWNPLTDDGDALRLAVKLNLTNVFHPALNQALVRQYHDKDQEWVENGEDHTDAYAATRRAIVRAAAAIATEKGD